MLLVACALLGSARAQTIELVEAAYEAALGDVEFPAGDAGALRVRRCGGCEPEVLAVTAATRYADAGASLSRLQFLSRVNALRMRPAGGHDVPVTIFHRAGSSDVTRVALHSAND